MAEELHKLIIKIFDKRKVQSLFIDNLWGVNLSDMHAIDKQI